MTTHLETLFFLAVALIGGTLAVFIASACTPKGADW